MSLHYFERWNFLADRPIDPISADQAASRYDSGPWFSVAESEDPDFGQQGHPPAYLLEIEPQAKAVRVYFFTPAGSVDLVHWFELRDEKLFLAQAIYYQYADGDKHRQLESVFSSTFGFSPDGTVSIRDDDKSQPAVSTSQRRDVDLSANWEPVPAFGEWASLARRER